MMKIVHMSSAHPRFDVRIFEKMCTYLIANNYSVSLIVADGKGNCNVNKVAIYDVGLPGGRLLRMAITPFKILLKALKIEADIFHLHDPELLTIGLILKLFGRKVIFDSHEDVPMQILSKPYLNQTAAKFVSFVYGGFEKKVLQFFDGIIAATPFIAEKLAFSCKNVTTISNYPIQDEYFQDCSKQRLGSNIFSYVGVVTDLRGIKELVCAANRVSPDITLCIAGPIPDKKFEEELLYLARNKNIQFLGEISRNSVNQLLRKSIAGFVTFKAVPNHVDAQPNKLFEYMGAGLPVIASNFPLWAKIVDGNGCGIVVDPENPDEIATAIQFIMSHPSEALEFGRRGRQAVMHKYNWETEFKKLCHFYETLCGDTHNAY